MAIYTAENTIEVGKPIKVFLDGGEVVGDRCDYVDTDAGYVMVARLDAHGGIFCEPDGKIAREKFEGVVTVEFL